MRIILMILIILGSLGGKGGRGEISVSLCPIRANAAESNLLDAKGRKSLPSSGKIIEGNPTEDFLRDRFLPASHISS